MLPGMSPASTDLSGAWARFERALAAHIPELLADLAPGASDADLNALAAATGLDLPASMRAFYRAHDGQRGETPGVFFEIVFLSCQGAATEWRNWAEMLRDDPTLAAAIEATAQPEGAVQAVYAHAGWIPIAHDGSGNHLAVDLAPGPEGVAGQVICFGPDEPVRYVVAPSALHLVAWCAQMLETGGAFVTPEGTFRIGDATNLLDALPALMAA